MKINFRVLAAVFFLRLKNNLLNLGTRLLKTFFNSPLDTLNANQREQVLWGALAWGEFF